MAQSGADGRDVGSGLEAWTADQSLRYWCSSATTAPLKPWSAPERHSSFWCPLFAAAVVAAPALTAKKPQPIVFPLIGKIDVDDNYGDARANGRHAGIDMMTPRRTPVVAAEAGTIKWWTTSARAGCMLYLRGSSGTTYLYIHLNNDRTLGNDNDGGCVRGSTYVARDGAKVTAGELIAWSGDSGDADGNPHLHFEVHPNDGADVNPYSYLLAGERLLFPGRLGTRFTIGLRGTPSSAGAGAISLEAAVGSLVAGRTVDAARQPTRPPARDRVDAGRRVARGRGRGNERAGGCALQRMLR